jgi:UDP-glucuronate decarboxylase
MILGMKTILITGASGFIGTNLTKRLLDEGNKVIAVDNFYCSSEINTNAFLSNPNYTFINHDIRRPLSVEGHIDQIFNLACPASPPNYQKDPLFTLDTNVLGIKNMLDLAKEKNAKILQASTSEIYGNPLVHPQKETYWGNVNINGIRSCYDEGKRITETYCVEYNRMFQTKVKIIRIFNTYGPNMDPADGRVVSNFIMQALRGENITIYGDGSQTRSFQFVDDLVEGMVRVIETDDSFIGPVNLGNPVEFTIKELAELVIKKINPEISIIYHDLPQDDPLQRKPDITLAKEKLDWEPKVPLEEGLVETIEYFRGFVEV